MVVWIYPVLAVLLLAKQQNALLISPSTTRSQYHRPSLSSQHTTTVRYTNEISNNHGQITHYHDNHHSYFERRHEALPLYSSASDTIVESKDDTVLSDVDTAPLSVTMGVGIVSSFIGYLYSKCMKNGFHLLWSTLPSKIFGCTSSFKLFKLLNQYPAAYIVLMMTLGGGLVATLSTLYFPKLFSAHDFVHILSKDDGANMDDFPSARKHLLPVMLLSCLMSITGFSLGPEGPMVTIGGLVGVSIARKYLQSTNKKSASVEEALAYAGAAGTLTGFMNIPLAGPIFALEMTSRRSGFTPFAAKSWSLAMAASLAGLVFVRGGLVPNMNVGGHFTYGAKAAVGSVTGKEMVLASLACGVGGAVVGTCFHKVTSFLKSIIWKSKHQSSSTDKKEKYVSIMKKILIALAIGVLSIFYPQTMFWGEGSLQCVVDGQCTPFSATPHGIPHLMTEFARVNPNAPYTSGSAALQVGVAKFMAIALASAAKFPGGVIFPLLSNGASFAHAFKSAVCPLMPVASSSLVDPLVVMSFMAATLTSITRTPLATVLILALTASGMTPLSVLLPGVLMASYVSVWVSNRLSSDSFFSYTK